jgi:uncharacterized damage-inducible protein DinB
MKVAGFFCINFTEYFREAESYQDRKKSKVNDCANEGAEDSHMPVQLSLDDLIDYTDWERQKWHERLRQQGNEVLKTGVGPHGDGRFGTVGDLVRHIFSAEKRYVERLLVRPLTDTSYVPADNLEALFQFGDESRRELKDFVEAFPAEKWDVPFEFKLINSVLRVTPKKIIVHVLVHEMRHWAQIATLLRQNGMTGEFHDFLFSTAMGGERERASC